MAVVTPATRQSYRMRWAWRVAGVVALVLAAGALAYLLTPYAVLRDWYLGLTPNLYRAATWPQNFFTPATKARGNWFCGGGLLLLAGSWVGASWPRRAPAVEEVANDVDSTTSANWLSRADGPYLAGLLLAAAGLWGWGATHLPPAYDEVFSAVYSAGSGSVFVAWSYYMLPNNHLLFNVLNGSLFGWLGKITWLVATGRVLSGLAYVATVVVVYRTLAALTGRRALAAALALLAAVQYSLWGFGCQARGYALYALLHWLAVATLLRYWQRPTRGSLWANALAVALGYAVVPTFLFYHVAQLLAAAAVQARRRRVEARFWKAQAGALVAVYWFYLPALCFSGLAALTANPYVRPRHGSLGQFVAHAWPGFRDYAAYCFGTAGLRNWGSYGLALLPLLLLVWPAAKATSAGRPWRRLALLYAAWLLVLAAGTAKLQLLVFPRNLLGLFSFLLVLSVLALSALLSRGRRWAGLVLPLAVAGGLGVGFLRHNPVGDPSQLYNSNVLGDYRLGQQRVSALPATGTLAFSEESFYPYFLSQQAGRSAPHPAHQPTLAADYFLIAPNDGLPPYLAARYQAIDTVGGYRLFRRRGGGLGQ